MKARWKADRDGVAGCKGAGGTRVGFLIRSVSLTLSAGLALKGDACAELITVHTVGAKTMGI